MTNLLCHWGFSKPLFTEHWLPFHTSKIHSTQQQSSNHYNRLFTPLSPLWIILKGEGNITEAQACFALPHCTSLDGSTQRPHHGQHTHVPQLSRLHPLLPYTTDSQKQYTTKIRHSKSFVIHRSKVTNTHLLFKKMNCRKQSQLTLLVQRKFCTTGPQVTTRRYWVFIVTHWFCVFLFDGQNHSNKQHPTAMDSTTFTVITDHSSETYTMQYMTKMATLMS